MLLSETLGNQFRNSYDVSIWLLSGPILLQYGFSVEFRYIVFLGLAFLPIVVVPESANIDIVVLLGGGFVLLSCTLLLVHRIELMEKALFLQVADAKQSCKNLLSVFETANTPIFRLDSDGRFLYSNKVSPCNPLGA